MPTKKYLGTITILVKDRHTYSPDVNRILSEQGNLVMARLGVNIQPLCMSGCHGLIAVAVQGSVKEIKDLTKKLNALYGIVAKSLVITK
jgi:metal-responsive CopG/Arc/MetJ family transcriptional regulator